MNHDHNFSLSYSIQRAFSLIELMIALAVLAILLGLAAPAFQEMVLNHRQTSQLNQLIGSLALARAEAIKRRQAVGICKSHDGQFCTHSGEWDQGWIVFADNNDSRQREPDEALLASYSGSPQMTLRYGGFPSDNYVIYYPDGRSLGNGTFTHCDSRSEAQARAVILARSGRVRSSDTRPNGDPLTCG